MARSAGQRPGGGRQAAPGKRKRACGGTEKATEVEVMTAIRLVISLWELIWTIARDDHWLGGGPGRLL
jgi:hypothetical protein